VKRVVIAVLLGAALAGCGVSSQDEPEILRSPPPAPTAIPSATERPTAPSSFATPSETPTPTPTTLTTTEGPGASPFATDRPTPSVAVTP
jgi:hypothetical protein